MFSTTFLVISQKFSISRFAFNFPADTSMNQVSLEWKQQRCRNTNDDTIWKHFIVTRSSETMIYYLQMISINRWFCFGAECYVFFLKTFLVNHFFSIWFLAIHSIQNVRSSCRCWFSVRKAILYEPTYKLHIAHINWWWRYCW